MLPRENKEVIDPYNEKDVPFDAILPIGETIAILAPHIYKLCCYCLESLLLNFLCVSKDVLQAMLLQ